MKSSRIKRTKFQEKVLSKFRTQLDFCTEIKISNSRLSNIITGALDPNREDVKRFAEGLSLSRSEVQELLGLDWGDSKKKREVYFE